VLRRIFGSKRDEVMEIGENCIMRFILLAKHNENDQVKDDEMGSECSTNSGEEECI
jgi:hypothetical protein